MEPNLQLKPSPGCKELLLKKLSYAVIASIVSQLAIIFVYLLVINFSLLHPLDWFVITSKTFTSVSTWLYVVPFLSIIFAQSVICAKDYVFRSSYNVSRIQKILSTISLRNALLFGLHVFSGGLLIWLYLSLAGGQYSSVFSIDKQDRYQLNRHTFYLISCGFWIGLYYFMRIYTFEKRILFPVIHQPKLLQFKSGLIPLVQNSYKGAIWPVIYFMVIYFFLGKAMENYINEMFQLHKPDHSLSYFTFFLSWFFSTIYLLVMNLMRFFFELFLTEPIDFPILSITNNDLTLLNGLAVGNMPIVQHLACFDLFNFSRNSPEKRKVLFTLSQPGNHPHNWNNLISNILQIITTFTETINLSVNAILNPESDKKIEAPLESQQPVIQIYAYKNMRTLSVLKPEIPLNLISVTQNKVIPFTSPVNVFMDTIIHKFKALITMLKAKFGINYLFGRLPVKNIQCCLEDGQIIIWIIQGISNLTIASLNEDNYGIAHKDMPTILSALVELKLSMEKLNRIPTFTKKTQIVDDFNIKMKTGINSAVKRSLYNICKHFRPYINDIPIKKDVLQYLQPYFLE